MPNDIAGVKTKWGGRVLVVEYNKQRNECLCRFDGTISVFTLSRSAIVDNDEALNECIRAVAKHSAHISAGRWQTILAAVQDEETSAIRERTDNDSNQHVQLPTDSCSDG